MMSRYRIYIVIVIALLISAGNYFLSRAEGRPNSMVIGVYVRIDASNWEAGSVAVEQTMTLDPEWLMEWNYNSADQLPSVIHVRREIQLSQNSLDYEFNMPLFPIDDNGNASIQVRSPSTDNVVTIDGMVCDYDCEELRVQVTALPVDTFTQALNGRNVTEIRYRSTETVEWELANIHEPVAFTFVPVLPAAPFLRTLVENPTLLLGGALGALLTFASGVLIAVSKDSLIARLRQLRQKDRVL